jgi:hypothetical protein
MRIKVFVVSAAVAVFGIIGLAAPAGASKCDDSIEQACSVAATIICKVVAKGEPCLM